MVLVKPLLSTANTDEHDFMFPHMRYKSTRIITVLGHYPVIHCVLLTVMKWYHQTRGIIPPIDCDLLKS